MTYSITEPWHHEHDGSLTNTMIPGITITRLTHDAVWRVIGRDGNLLFYAQTLHAAKAAIEDIALAGAEGQAS